MGSKRQTLVLPAEPFQEEQCSAYHDFIRHFALTPTSTATTTRAGRVGDGKKQRRGLLYLMASPVKARFSPNGDTSFPRTDQAADIIAKKQITIYLNSTTADQNSICAWEPWISLGLLAARICVPRFLWALLRYYTYCFLLLAIRSPLVVLLYPNSPFTFRPFFAIFFYSLSLHTNSQLFPPSSNLIYPPLGPFVL